MNKYKQIKLLIIVLAMIFINMTSVFAQSTCISSTNINMENRMAFSSQTAVANEHWINFTSNNDSASIEVYDDNFNVNLIEVYSGNCSNNTLLFTTTNKDLLMTNLEIGSNYLVKFSSNSSNGSFNVRLANSFPTLYIKRNGTLLNGVNMNDICVADGDKFEVWAAWGYVSGAPSHYLFDFASMGINNWVSVPSTGNPLSSNLHIFTVPNNVTLGQMYVHVLVSWNGYDFFGNYSWDGWPNRVKLDIQDIPDMTSFNPTPNPACPLETVGHNFSPTPYSGGWGDGTTISSSLGYNSNTYAQSGIYNANISTSNVCGTNSKEVSVNVTITPDFSFSNTCVGNGVQFTGISTCSSVIGEWYWDFGDATGTFSNSMTNPTHTYNSPGTYNVTLKLVSNYNAPSTGSPEEFTVTKQIVIYPKPAVASIVGINNSCDGVDDILYSIDNNVTGNTYNWSISQGQGTFNNTTNTTATGISNTIDWSNIPTLPSNAQIEISTTDENGCQSISHKNVFECCGKNEPSDWTDETISDDLTFTDKTVVINGILTIDANVVFDVSASNLQNHIFMGPEAKIIVTSGNSVTFDNSIIISECDYMWDGIYLNGGSSSIIFTNSVMYDAINGIVADNGAIVNSVNSNFINNYKSIQISNYIPNALNPVDYSGSINGCQFYTENNNINNGSMIIPENDNDYMLKLAPYSGKQAYAGIMINKVGRINIGDANENQNIFAKQQYGIHAITSNATIKNNKFLYINKKTYNGQVSLMTKLPESAAIYGIYHNSSIHYLNSISKTMEIGDLSLSDGNYSNFFDYCSIGVYANNYRTKLYRNKLENTSNTALYLYDIISSTDVQYNYINSNSNIQNYRGINCVNTTSRNLKMNIENNFIYKSKWGISLINCSSFNFSNISLLVKVNNNSIMLNPTNNVKQYAIRAASCDRIEIKENTITRLGTSSSEDAANVVGISLRQTQSAKVTDNYIYRMGSGIMTNGAMFNTQFFCNTFSNSYNGFYFSDETALTNFGWKNVSGLNDFNPQNKWVNCFGEKMFNHDIINNSPVDYYYYGQNSGIHDFINDPEIVTSSNTWFKIKPIESNQASFYCSNSNGPNVIIRDDELSSDVDRDALLEEFILGVQYSELQAEFRSYEIDYLYKVLDNEPTVMWLGSSEDEEYEEFYDEYKNSINAKFIDIDNLINEGSYAEAFEINNTIAANTTMDLNRKVSNRIYLESYIIDNYAMDESTINVLTNIASQSPYKGGYGVYTARVMLDYDPDQNGVSWRIAEQSKVKEETKIRVFPNPVKDVLFIEVLSEMSSYGATLEVYNAMGQNILNKTLNNKMEFINLEGLTTGLYIYSIKYENGHSEKGKFIVK